MNLEDSCHDRSCCKCGSTAYVGMGDREFCYNCFCKIPGVILMINRVLWELRLFAINITERFPGNRESSRTIIHRRT